jgi:hypothetical protein
VEPVKEMKLSRLKKLVALALGLFMLASVLALIRASCVHDLTTEQLAVARDLGVNPWDYPPVYLFPRSYYRVILKPGMTMAEVHALIRGYTRVLQCKSSSSTSSWELYYYFSPDDYDALRFRVIYDQQGRMKAFGEEDESSPSFLTEDCVPGRIGE